MRELTTRYLERRGYNTIGAESALLGLRLLGKDHFDALISDIKMPHMDGVEFARKAKELSPNLVILLLTGHASFDSAQQAIKIGIHDYLTKPVDMGKLQESLEEGLSRVEEKKNSLEYYLKLEKEIKEDKARLDAMKEELITLISHELRTPVTIISACFDLLKDTMDMPSGEKMKSLGEDEKKNILSSIEKGRLRLINIIDDMNCYLNLSKGQVRLEKSPIDFNGILENNFVALKSLIQERKVVLKKDLKETKGIKANICKEKIIDVLERLIANAAFHNPEGTEIVLRTELASGENEHGSETKSIKITVSDNGRGIERSLLENIFTSFSAGDLVRHKGGVGMGLCICKKIIELHNGSLILSSEEGKGTTATITVPI